MSMTSVFAEITKTAPQEDGSLMVYGKATGSDLDLDGQRCDNVWLQSAMPEFMRIGNVREQHDPHRAVGKAVEHDVKDDGHYIRARIVDPVAVAKTKAGVFTGFSIGIKSPIIEKSNDAPNGLISGGSICEISLVDRPALASAILTVCKAAKPGMSVKSGDFDAKRLLVRCEEYVEKTVTADATKADVPEMTVKLSDALSPEQIEKLASVVEEKTVEAEVEKVTDVAQLDAPNHSQTCVRCAEPGHLWCAPEGFDKDFAVGLVHETIEKASGDGLGQDETGDISGAEAAIAAIAALIISEAQDLANMPSQGCDIHLLMSAVDALRIFACREKLEQGAIDPDSMICLAVGPDAIPGTVDDRGNLVKAKYTADELRQMLKDGKAFKNPDGDPSYPIGDKDDLKNAIHAVGRGAGDHDAIRAYIVKRAKALGASDMIPDSWTSSGSNDSNSKSVESEKEKPVQVEKTYTLDEARTELGLPPVESDVVKTITESDVEKTVDADTTKTTAPDAEKAAGAEVDNDALVKAFTASLEKADSPLRKSFEAIVAASTKTIAETLDAQSERLVKVESMATPGGPALRRTEIETKTAQKSELLRQAEYWRIKSENIPDPDLKKGWANTAAEFLAKADALAV